MSRKQTRSGYINPLEKMNRTIDKTHRDALKGLADKQKTKETHMDTNETQTTQPSNQELLNRLNQLQEQMNEQSRRNDDVNAQFIESQAQVKRLQAKVLTQVSDPDFLAAKAIITLRPYEKYVMAFGFGLGAYTGYQATYQATKRVLPVLGFGVIGGMYALGCWHLGARIGAWAGTRTKSE